MQITESLVVIFASFIVVNLYFTESSASDEASTCVWKQKLSERLQRVCAGINTLS